MDLVASGDDFKEGFFLWTRGFGQGLLKHFQLGFLIFHSFTRSIFKKFLADVAYGHGHGR